MKNVFIIFITTLMLSSCASIFGPAKQTVTIDTPSSNTLVVNGTNYGKQRKIKLKKSEESHQIEYKRDGFKTEYDGITFSKSSILRWGNFLIGLGSHLIPFEAKIMTLNFWGASILYFSLDKFSKAMKYPNQISGGKNLVVFPEKQEDFKNIVVENVILDLEEDGFVVNSHYYSHFLKGKDPISSKIDNSFKGIKENSSVFTDILNDLLISTNYVDTADELLKEVYTENLFFEASLKRIVFNTIESRGYLGSDSELIFVEMDIEWSVKDMYGATLLKLNTNSKSGKFVYKYQKEDDAIERCLGDAFEYALIDLLKQNKLHVVLTDRSQAELEKNFEVIKIPSSEKYVSNSNEAVKASVTVKVKDGHGSGFFISKEGHIISNYHVVADTDSISVVLNNGITYKAEVLRASKIADLCLLKIQPVDIVPFQLSQSREIGVAQELYAVGTPSSEQLSQTISKGIVSGKRKTRTFDQLIQTDAKINRGNSGGAMINKEGLVIGVATYKISGLFIEGIAFGIPAYEIFDRLKIKVE